MMTMVEKKKTLMTELAVVVISPEKARSKRQALACCRQRKSWENIKREEVYADVVECRSCEVQRMPCARYAVSPFRLEPRRGGLQYAASGGGGNRWGTCSADGWSLSYCRRVFLIPIPTKRAISHTDSTLRCEHAWER